MASHNRKKKKQPKKHRHWCTQCEQENYRFSVLPKNYSPPVFQDCRVVNQYPLHPKVISRMEKCQAQGWFKRAVSSLLGKFNFTLFNRK
jgi:tRNA U38,U39,U40 pseudouridine synthase TruA